MRRVVLFLLLTAALASALVDVIFMVTDNRNIWIEAINFLKNDGRFGDVDYYDCGNYNAPPLEFFLQYDVVIFGGSGDIKQNVVFGDRLADYVDSGGRVVVEAGKLYGVFGRWHDDGYAPYYSESYDMLEGNQDLIIDEPGHAIFDGVAGLWDCYWRADVLLRPDALELAHFPDVGGVAVNAARNVVGLNYTASRGWTGDGFLIMANAACWLASQSAVEETSWGEIKALFE